MAIIANNRHEENSTEAHLTNLSNTKHYPIIYPVLPENEQKTRQTIQQTNTGTNIGSKARSIVWYIKITKDKSISIEPVGRVTIDGVLQALYIGE